MFNRWILYWIVIIFYDKCFKDELKINKKLRLE